MNQYATQLGEGRMGKLIAAYDWTSTSLGSLETWPAALRSVVELILGQRHAICVFWGPDLTLLYNDAYAPILGAKEEGALGQLRQKYGGMCGMTSSPSWIRRFPAKARGQRSFRSS